MSLQTIIQDFAGKVYGQVPTSLSLKDALVRTGLPPTTACFDKDGAKTTAVPSAVMQIVPQPRFLTASDILEQQIQESTKVLHRLGCLDALNKELERYREHLVFTSAELVRRKLFDKVLSSRLSSAEEEEAWRHIKCLLAMTGYTMTSRSHDLIRFHITPR